MRIFEAKINYSLLSMGESERIDSPKQAAEYLKNAFDEDPTVEWFFVILLDAKNHPIGRYAVSKGTASSSLVHPREVFKAAVLAGATNIVLGHNHPSGDPAPSRADISVTQKLIKAGKVMDIPITDHIIIGHKEADPLGVGYYSFSDAGIL